MNLEGLLKDPPGTHLDSAGNPVAWQLAVPVLEVIDEHVTADSETLETGAGFSTGLFAIKGCKHTCVVPWTVERDRLHAWAERVGVSMDRVKFECERSEDVLPRLERTPLDFVLIDGGHGFPTPFIDWWYAGRRLKKGGLLAIDDTELWTGRVLSNFLKEQGGWELVRSVPLRSIVFRRVEEPSDALEEWSDHPYVKRRSYVGGGRGLVRKAVRGAERIRSRLPGRARG